MVETFLTRVARFVAPAFIQSLENAVKEKELEVNQRVANVIATMDPYEPYMRRFKGVFSEEFDNPEDKLNEQSRVGMYMWGYQQDNDPNFKFVTNWIINTQANATIKRKNISVDEMLYCRAKITTAIQLRDEVRRLANIYRDILDKEAQDSEPDIGTAVE